MQLVQSMRLMAPSFYTLQSFFAVLIDAPTIPVKLQLSSSYLNG